MTVATLVDSNVILDVVTQDATWSSWSAGALAQAADAGALVISPIVYAEVSVGFSRVEDVDDALGDFVREPLPWSAAFLAGKAFLSHRRRDGRRTSTLPDFCIGAHAAIAGHALLTRDASRYRTYFPTVTVLAP